VNREEATNFLNRYVSIKRVICSTPVFSKGTLVGVGEATLLLNFHGKLQSYDLNTIESIREVW